MKFNINVSVANPIEEDSWLNESRFAKFKHAYLYASQCTQAIPALSKITPEDVYYLYLILGDGEDDYCLNYTCKYYVIQLTVERNPKFLRSIENVYGHLCCESGSFENALRITTALKEGTLEKIRKDYPQAKLMQVTAKSTVEECTQKSIE